MKGRLSEEFRNADELEALLLQAQPATAMTAERKARIYGNLKRWRDVAGSGLPFRSGGHKLPPK